MNVLNNSTGWGINQYKTLPEIQEGFYTYPSFRVCLSADRRSEESSGWETINCFLYPGIFRLPSTTPSLNRRCKY